MIFNDFLSAQINGSFLFGKAYGFYSLNPEMRSENDGILPTGRYFVYCLHPREGSVYFILEITTKGAWSSKNHPPFITEEFISFLGLEVSRKYKGKINYPAEVIDTDFPFEKRSDFEGGPIRTPGPPVPRPPVMVALKPVSSVKRGSKPTSKTPVHIQPSGDLVKCSVYAPETSLPGKTIMVQVFAHLPGEKKKVDKIALGYDKASMERQSKELENLIDHDTKLTFHLLMRGVEVDDPMQTIVWRGHYDSVQFGVSIPSSQTDDNIIGTIHVNQEGVPIGNLKFTLKVDANYDPVKTENDKLKVSGTWNRYRYAFISYASPDRSEVLKRVQMFPRFKIDFFQDLLTLEPGDRWEKEIYKYIDKADVFFLFWSQSAKDSEWVKKEILYAIQKAASKKSGAPVIEPIIIDSKKFVEPPEELKNLHFNDLFMYYIKGSEKI